jgi:hypothetical protein
MLVAVFFVGFFVGYTVFAFQVVVKFRKSVGEPEYKWGDYLVKVRRG